MHTMCILPKKRRTTPETKESPVNIVIVGAQWGDEGKGKMVDYLAEDAKITVRYSGGANAGHTIITGNTIYKVHLVPSGIVGKDKIAVLGSGMVIDPEALFSELEELKSQGLDWEGRVLVSDRAHLVLPHYKDLDKDMESKRRIPIGTTGRGIGIAYAQKAQRDGLRVGDLYSQSVWNTLSESEKSYLTPYKDKMKSMVINQASFMAKHKGENTLFEGAQGVLLDLDIGTYPFVSSGVSAAAGASLGGGIGPRAIDKILGVFKAYCTRVGNGPFPTEFKAGRDEEKGLKLREIGKEFGVTTGRARRCGYLDLVALKYVVQTNSIDGLIITKMDIYDTFDEISVCTAYDINGTKTEDFPTSCDELETVVPVTKSFKGWMTDLTACKSYLDLPQEAKVYLKFIEDYLGTPISVVSVGPDRDQTFYREAVWTKS